MKYPQLKLLICFPVLLMSFLCVDLQAQNTITGEGVSGDVDKKRRSPTVSISTHNNGGSVKILVDAYIADPEFKHYPIQFDFYVNRRFFTSQIRSNELPGPIGVDIGSNTAVTPFNYTVIARTLHPNREFTTVINGAVFSSNLARIFDCTLTTQINSDDPRDYIANNISFDQSGNNSLSIGFEAHSTPSGHRVVLAGSLTISGSEANGIFSLAENNSPTRTVNLNGNADMSNGSLSAISLTSSDSDVALSCS